MATARLNFAPHHFFKRNYLQKKECSSRLVRSNLERSAPSFQMMMMFQVVWTFPRVVVWDDCNCFPKLFSFSSPEGLLPPPRPASHSLTLRCHSGQKAICQLSFSGGESQSKAVVFLDGSRGEIVDDRRIGVAFLSPYRRLTEQKQTCHRFTHTTT